jgi:hypothetical protein
MLGQHNLAWQLRKEGGRFDLRSGTWDDLVAEIESDDARNVIVSSEDLDMLDRDAIEKVGDFLAGYRVRIIVYVRRQDLAIQSAYGSAVKRGRYLKDFQSYLEKQFSSEPRLRYDSLVAPWKDRFGLTNIVVRPVESGQLHGDLCRDLMHCTGMDEEAIGRLDAVPDLNVSPGLKTLEAARLATRIMRLISADPRRHYQGMKALLKHGEKNGWNAEKPNLISRQDYERILDEYGESNAAVAREYLSRNDGRLFLDSFKDTGVSKFDVADFSDEEFLEISSIVAKHRN